MLEMDAELEQYILAHSEPEGEVLAELSRADPSECICVRECYPGICKGSS